MNLPAGRSRPIVREIATFATIGAASTIAALALLAATLRHPALAGAQQTSSLQHSENPPSVLMTP